MKRVRDAADRSRTNLLKCIADRTIPIRRTRDADRPMLLILLAPEVDEEHIELIDTFELDPRTVGILLCEKIVDEAICLYLVLPSVKEYQNSPPKREYFEKCIDSRPDPFRFPQNPQSFVDDAFITVCWEYGTSFCRERFATLWAFDQAQNRLQ